MSYLFRTTLGVILSDICMMICDILVNKKFSINSSNTKSNLLKTGIIVSIGLALAICLHDIPEVIAMCLGFCRWSNVIHCIRRTYTRV